MINNRTVMVRVTRDQHDRIKLNAIAKGYKTISQYIRHLALDKDMAFEKKFNELYNKLVKDAGEV